jgi:hypothetical protein
MNEISKSTRRRTNLIWIPFVLMLFSAIVHAEDIAKAPPEIQAALFVKLLGFDKTLSGNVSICVIGSPEFAVEMKKGIGKDIGNGKLASVSESAGLPSEKPSAVYLGDGSKANEVIAYARSNKVLSITGIPELVEKGISLGVGVSEGKPKVLLNMASSKEEGRDWNPAILKVAKIIQ